MRTASSGTKASKGGSLELLDKVCIRRSIGCKASDAISKKKLDAFARGEPEPSTVDHSAVEKLAELTTVIRRLLRQKT